MVEKSIEKFEVRYLQVLDESGKVDEKLMPKLSPSMIKEMYEAMVLTRVFDNKALKLQRQGRIGTYAPMIGQEACQIGSVFASDKKDVIFPAFRENGVYMVRGIPAEMLYWYWAGDERGMKLSKESGMFSISITVGGHVPHITGAAMAFKYLKDKRAAIGYFGDGATSEGDFHEGLNFAGALNSPAVFICQNNQWAISVPVHEQTAAKTIAQKAIAYGIEGIRVDGNDIFAVYKATSDALKRARAGKGPTLIECFTYRMADHTTSDDAKKYRKPSEVKKWEKKDPILRLEKYMQKKKILTEEYKKNVWEKAEKDIDASVEKFEAIPPQEPEEMFDYLYAEIPPYLEEQREIVREGIPLEEEHKKTTPVKEKGAGVVGELEEA